MSHSHAHSEPENTYFLDQLCTIAVGGLLGFTAVGLYRNGWLMTKFGLKENFQMAVLVGGITLLVLVVLRAGRLEAGGSTPCGPVGRRESRTWRGMRARTPSRRDSKQWRPRTFPRPRAFPRSRSCAWRGPANGAHEGHDHGWSPWQYAVLIIPAVLFFFGTAGGRLQQDAGRQGFGGSPARRNRGKQANCLCQRRRHCRAARHEETAGPTPEIQLDISYRVAAETAGGLVWRDCQNRRLCSEIRH